jgi:hypothetical protein
MANGIRQAMLGVPEQRRGAQIPARFVPRQIKAGDIKDLLPNDFARGYGSRYLRFYSHQIFHEFEVLIPNGPSEVKETALSKILSDFFQSFRKSERGFWDYLALATSFVKGPIDHAYHHMRGDVALQGVHTELSSHFRNLPNPASAFEYLEFAEMLERNRPESWIRKKGTDEFLEFRIHYTILQLGLYLESANGVELMRLCKYIQTRWTERHTQDESKELVYMLMVAAMKTQSPDHKKFFINRLCGFARAGEGDRLRAILNR